MAPELVPEQLLRRLDAEACRVLASASDARVLERDAVTVRAHHGAHLTSELFQGLTTASELVDCVTPLIGQRVYVHQFKINAKAGLRGDSWEWHQDFAFWHAEDGLPTPALVTIAIFLDEVTEFNGPLLFVPGSHRHGLLKDSLIPSIAAEAPPDRPEWLSGFTAHLKYTVSAQALASMLGNRNSIVFAKGPSGTVLLVDANVVHASGSNMSPFDRRMILITYNSVANQPVAPSHRPTFLAGADFTPIVPRYFWRSTDRQSDCQ